MILLATDHEQFDYPQIQEFAQCIVDIWTNLTIPVTVVRRDPARSWVNAAQSEKVDRYKTDRLVGEGVPTCLLSGIEQRISGQRW